MSLSDLNVSFVIVLSRAQRCFYPAPLNDAIAHGIAALELD